MGGSVSSEFLLVSRGRTFVWQVKVSRHKLIGVNERHFYDSISLDFGHLFSFVFIDLVLTSNIVSS